MVQVKHKQTGAIRNVSDQYLKIHKNEYELVERVENVNPTLKEFMAMHESKDKGDIRELADAEGIDLDGRHSKEKMLTEYYNNKFQHKMVMMGYSNKGY